MAWSKMYIRSSITKKSGLFVAKIVWSFYGIQHWEEFEIFATQHEAELWVLHQRTGGTLVIDVEENKENTENDKK